MRSPFSVLISLLTTYVLSPPDPSSARAWRVSGKGGYCAALYSRGRGCQEFKLDFDLDGSLK